MCTSRGLCQARSFWVRKEHYCFVSPFPGLRVAELAENKVKMALYVIPRSVLSVRMYVCPETEKRSTKDRRLAKRANSESTETMHIIYAPGEARCERFSE